MAYAAWLNEYCSATSFSVLRSFFPQTKRWINYSTKSKSAEATCKYMVLFWSCLELSGYDTRISGPLPRKRRVGLWACCIGNMKRNSGQWCLLRLISEKVYSIVASFVWYGKSIRPCKDMACRPHHHGISSHVLQSWHIADGHCWPHLSLVEVQDERITEGK